MKYLYRSLLLISRSAETLRTGLTAFHLTPGCVPLEDTHLIFFKTWLQLRAQVSSCLSFLSDELTVFAIILCEKANRFLGLTFCKWYTDWVKGTCLQSLLLDSRICRMFSFLTSIPRKEKERTLVLEMKLCLNYPTWLITGKLWLLFLSFLPYNWALRY